MPINVKGVRDYLPDMDEISEEIPDKIEASYREQRERNVTPADVRAVLQKDRLTPDDYYVLLSDVAEEFLDEMAVKARMLRRQYFGDNVNSFSPPFTLPITAKTAAVTAALIRKVALSAPCLRKKRSKTK